MANDKPKPDHPPVEPGKPDDVPKGPPIETEDGGHGSPPGGGGGGGKP